MKFADKIIKAIMWKKDEKLSRIEAILEHEAIKSKYTREQIKAGLAYEEACDRDVKRERREERRRVVVEWIGGFFAFICVNGSFIYFSHMIRLFDGWRPENSLLIVLFVIFFSALYTGYCLLLITIFYWLSNITGFRFLIEDWIGARASWDISEHRHNQLRFKGFPRRERVALVRDLDNMLNIINIWLMNLERNAVDDDDCKLCGDIQRIGSLIGSLANYSSGFISLSLFKYPGQEYPTWNTYSLQLEETTENLKIELKDIAKYHEKVQQVLEMAVYVTSQVFSIIIDNENRNETKKAFSQFVQILSLKKNK